MFYTCVKFFISRKRENLGASVASFWGLVVPAPLASALDLAAGAMAVAEALAVSFIAPAGADD